MIFWTLGQKEKLFHAFFFFTVCDPVSALQFHYFDWQQIFTFPKYDYVSEWFPFFLTAQHFAKIGVFLDVTQRSSSKGGESCVTPQ